MPTRVGDAFSLIILQILSKSSLAIINNVQQSSVSPWQSYPRPTIFSNYQKNPSAKFLSKLPGVIAKKTSTAVI